MPGIKLLEQKLITHIECAMKENKRIWESIDSIDSNIKNMKDNHLYHMETDIAILKEKAAMTIKVLWAMVSGLIANLIGVIYLIINVIIK